jgi:hypothetical protein
MIWPLLACSCSRQPAYFNVPRQQRAFTGQDPQPDLRYVAMSNPSVSRFIVKDIVAGPGGDRRRWTFSRPELRLLFHDAENQKLTANFDVVPDTFRVTGPITVAFFVNGARVGSVYCPKPGSYHFEAGIEDGILQSGEVTTVAAEADKPWTSPVDGAQLGFLLVDAGIFPR